MTTPWTPSDLQAFLTRHGVTARLIPDIGHTPTVPAAAQVLGVAPEQIVKTLLFVLEAGEKPDIPPAVVVIANGENRVEKRALGNRFGLNPKRVKMADPAQVIELIGYPAGGVPPFGHRTDLPILLDQAVAALDGQPVYAGGGDDRTMLETTVAELVRVLAPEVLPLCRPPAAADATT
jgi:prolyl-tRNA editing enzyme YbaK/EbsC (Cys-tRNA(Pro) deacylase)